MLKENETYDFEEITVQCNTTDYQFGIRFNLFILMVYSDVCRHVYGAF